MDLPENREAVMVIARSNAVLYMRMSTDRQVHSITHQRTALEAYAVANSFSIVGVYQDEGKSGLEIKSRPGLLSLIEVVQAGSQGFDTILVYDVSRWGRFQDVDESAHYEYLCRRAGVRVEYCAEQFANDDSPLASLLKGLKRAMAAEYSRELSAKVFRAQCNLTAIGFKQGGTAGYGLRRMLLNVDGTEKRVLAFGDRKAVLAERVIFCLGPPDEIAVIKRIYQMYVRDKLTQTAIAAKLNGDGVPSEFGRPWNLWSVKNILTNEKYIGNLVFNRRSAKLKGCQVHNRSEEWVRREDAFDAIITRQIFDEAICEREHRRKRLTDQGMLNALRSIFKKHGVVNARILAAEGAPSSTCYAEHFGSLVNAYMLAGLERTRFVTCGETKRAVHAAFRSTLARVLELIRAAGKSASVGERKGAILINGDVRLIITASRRRNEWGRVQWRFPTAFPTGADFVLCAQLDKANVGVMAYYLFACAEFDRPYVVLRQDEKSNFDHCRYSSLEAIFGLQKT